MSKTVSNKNGFLSRSLYNHGLSSGFMNKWGSQHSKDRSNKVGAGVVLGQKLRYSQNDFQKNRKGNDFEIGNN